MRWSSAQFFADLHQQLTKQVAAKRCLVLEKESVVMASVPGDSRRDESHRDNYEVEVSATMESDEADSCWTWR